MTHLDWKVGDRVVCVEDTWLSTGAHYRRGVVCPLQKGRIYTIRSIEPARGLYGGDNRAPIAVVLAEIIRDRIPGVEYSAGFNAARFRKVITRKTDISIFTALLNTTKTGVDA